MNPEPILYESHMHTPLCGHAHGEPTEYAAVAEQRGLKGIIVTCHNPPVDGWSPWARMAEDDFDRYLELVEEARREWAGRVDVRLGMEVDYAPHMVAGVERQLQWADFNHILGSVHPQIGEYRQLYFNGDPLDFQRTYFEHLAMAAESGLFDTLSHPDLIKNVFADTWDLTLVWDAVLDMLDRVAAAGTAMELNTSGLRKKVSEMNPSRSILVEMQKRDIPVVIGADAHTPDRVAANYGPAMLMLQEIGFTHINIFLNRQRQAIPIHEALATLHPIAIQNA